MCNWTNHGYVCTYEFIICVHVNYLEHTINWEIFLYKNIHVLNVRANKFSRVAHKNILTRKFCQVEITVHVLLIQQLLLY